MSVLIFFESLTTVFNAPRRARAYEVRVSFPYRFNVRFRA